MIYILVAVFNRQEITRRFLDALKRQTVSGFQVVLVDDGSTDGTANMVSSTFPEVELLRGKGDLWWTGSMRFGIDWILGRADPRDFVICANNDQIPREDAIEKLLLATRARGNAIVGSLSRDFKDPNRVYDAAFAWNWKKDRYMRVPIRSSGDLSEGIDVLTCRFTIVPVEVFRRINFRPDLFPHYLGDHDFFLNAKRAGYPLVLSYDSVVFDVGGPSGNFKPGWKLTLRELSDNFFGVRSHGNLRYMVRFYLRHCPSLVFRIRFVLRQFAKVIALTLAATAVSAFRLFKGVGRKVSE